jgi:hypothetical protein
VADAIVVCWNCNAVVAADRSECPRCKAGLGPEGRGLCDGRFRSEQIILKNRLGHASTFEKVLLWMMVLAVTVFVGGMIGAWVGGAVPSTCHDQGCFAQVFAGFLAGAGVGLLVVIVAFAIYWTSRFDVPVLSGDAEAVEEYPPDSVDS